MLKQRLSSLHLRQRGISLIELMVGLTVGMIVVAGASLMMTNQLAEHRRLILETQVQQDLRAAADLILRDLRRAGYWALPQHGVSAPGLPAVANVYSNVSNVNDVVTYSYSRHDNLTGGQTPSNPEDDVLTANKETFGFRRSGDGVLQFNLGGTWQPLTDKNTLIVEQFAIVLNTQAVPLADYCTSPCPAGLACPPTQFLRRFDITLTGRATHDDRVVRSINVSSRVRNDAIVGSCAP